MEQRPLLFLGQKATIGLVGKGYPVRVSLIPGACTVDVLRVLFRKEFNGKAGSGWVAIGLEKSLVAQGDTLPETWEAFQVTLNEQIRLDRADGKKPLECFKKAPQDVFDDWQTAWKVQELNKRIQQSKRVHARSGPRLRLPTIREMRVAV